MAAKPLAEWTDNEIRSKLSALGQNAVPITATTRPFLLKKIEKSLQTAGREVSHSSQDASQVGAGSEGLEANSGGLARELEQQESLSVEGYYTIHVTDGGEREEEESCPLYTSRADTLKAVKNTPGARFKKFESKDAALAYLESKKQRDVEKVTGESEDTDSSFKTTVSSEKANNFPSLKTPALNKFRKLIEEGNKENFRESVWSNPRYLITSGDTPEILQQGCRYNALHCAVRKGNIDMCKELMNIIEGDRFWELVYPDDSVTIRQTRKVHLVDLYLNMQDKVNRETPLHFACKYGYVDIVALLLSFPCTCQTIKNKYGQMPADVVCKDGNQPAKSRIEQLLKEPEIYYVPVLRSEDNSTPPQLFSPCTLPELANQSPLLNSSDITSPIVSHALAGPMSPSRAKDFYKEWRSPSHSVDKKETKFVKRSDADRGLERVGRKLAHNQGVGWMEYWDFLSCSCDLSLPEGHLIMEEYLKELSNTTANLSQSLLDNREESESPLSLSTPSSARTANPKPLVLEGVSGEQFCENGYEDGDSVDQPSLDDDKKTKKIGDVDNVVDSLADLLEKNLSFNDEEETDSCTSKNPTPTTAFSNPIFLAGSKPSKLDLDVMRALDGVQPDPVKFPNLHHWLKNVKSYSEQQQKCWRTPTSLKQRPLRSFKTAVESSSQPISPLVFSSPSSSARRDQSFTGTGGSSPPSNHTITTPKRQQTQTPGRYFDFGRSPHQTRPLVGYRSTGTTPQCNGSHASGQTRTVSQFRAPH